eukprot:2477784-Pyramimonas_sp.AAC.1
MPIGRELLPMAPPFPQEDQLCHPASERRAVRRRAHVRRHWQAWANSAVQCLSEMFGCTIHPPPGLGEPLAQRS